MSRQTKLKTLEKRFEPPEPIPVKDGNDGAPGAKGDKGDPGQDAQVDYGQVKSFVKEEVSTIPKPKDGKDGKDGVSIKGEKGIQFQHAWEEGISYSVDDVVTNAGSSYICVVQHTSNITTSPGIASQWETVWEVLAKKGDAGTGGGKGADGMPGQQGAAGQGVPVGGTTNQILAKSSNSDYDTNWVDPSGGGGAVDSVNGQVGVVILDASDVGADPSGAASTAQSNAEAYTDLETTRAQGAESTLQSNISSEASTRSSADTTLQGNITSEVNRATAAEALLVPKTTTVNGHALSANVTVSKSDVGLGNVDNTSDASKPVSTAQQTALDLKQNLSAKDVANGYAGLDSSGLINPSQLPATAITDTFVVGSQAAMLALTAQTGDIAVRTDLNKSYILTASPASTLSNWQELLTPTDTVQSVFGRSGTVTSQNGDYTASQITNVPAGNVASTTVQGALNELDSEKQVADSDLTAIAALDSSVSGMIASDGAGWIKKTYAQVKTALGLVKADVGLGSVDNTSDVDKPVSTAQQTAIDAKVENSIVGGHTTIAPSGSAVSAALALKEALANKATDFSTVNNTLYPTVQAVNNAITTAVTGLLDYRGTYDASTNLFPATGGSGVLGAVLKGDFWICSIAGTLGGTAVAPGDLIIATVDTPAQIAANWDIIEYDLGYAPENVANKSIDGSFAANSDTLYPSQKAAKTYADSKVEDAINDGVTTKAPSENAVFDALALKSSAVPQKPTAGYTITSNTQVLFFTNIDMTAANGDLTVIGLLQGVH